MDIKIATALIAVIAALITTLITQYLTTKQFNTSVKEHYRKLYFERQLLAYEALWSKLRPLSQYHDKKTLLLRKKEDGITVWKLSVENTQLFCGDITDFFFSNNGIYLTKSTRKAIFDLRWKLVGVTSRHPNEKQIIVIGNDDRKEINKQITVLTDSVRKDIGLLNLSFDINKLGIPTESLNNESD
jgi:hypothetical protein